MPATYSLRENTYHNIDPRQLQQFMRSPTVTDSLSSEGRSRMLRRIKTAEWTPEMILVWDAVAEGYDTVDSLPIATGLSIPKINSALHRLDKSGEVKGILKLERAPARI